MFKGLECLFSEGGHLFDLGLQTKHLLAQISIGILQLPKRLRCYRWWFNFFVLIFNFNDLPSPGAFSSGDEAPPHGPASVPGHTLRSHFSPAHPASQTQATPVHVPWPEQPLSSSVHRDDTEHDGPRQPGSHAHTPGRTQRPCGALQPATHARRSHAAPAQPSSHSHAPAESQWPWPEHPAHVGTEQS